MSQKGSFFVSSVLDEPLSCRILKSRKTVAPEAKMSLPGWALASAMRSLTDLTPNADDTISAFVLIELVDQSSALTEHWKLAEGLIIIAVVLAIPGGVQSLIARIAPERQHD